MFIFLGKTNPAGKVGEPASKKPKAMVLTFGFPLV
jgi:hypothetical protein